MRYLTLFLMPILLICFPVFSQKTNSINGIIDLSGYESKSITRIKLNGEWKFFENRFILSDQDSLAKDSFIFVRVPLSWNKFENAKGLKNGLGYGSYSLKIIRKKGEKQTLLFKEIGSSYKVWLNGELQAEIGTVGKNRSVSVPSFESFNLDLPDIEEVDLVIEVANFHQSLGGLKMHVTLIDSKNVAMHQQEEFLLKSFCLGIIFIMGLYHLGLFFLNKQELASFNFGLFCFVIFIFVVSRSRIIYNFNPEFDWVLGNRIEYISIYLSLPLFYTFFQLSFPKQFNKYFNLLAIIISSSLITIVIFTDVVFFTSTLSYFHFVLLMYVVIVLVGLIRATISKRRGSLLLLSGFNIFMLALINDILHVQNIIDTGNYISLGVFGFIIFQAFFLAYRSANYNKKVALLSINLKDLNQSLERFVPAGFMTLLKKKDITEVNLGDFAEKEMTIMFSDIRGFTSISEKLSSEDSFSFVNDYLRTMAPIIRNHNGFIDKYLGDGIMALFPTNPNDALACAKKMRDALNLFNEQSRMSGKPVIDIGIGLHTGLCIIGTVGEQRRIDTTVISDAVNLTARIESLTKHYKTPIILSGETVQRLSHDEISNLRFIGSVVVRGKTLQTDLYTPYINNDVDQSLKELFNQAVVCYCNKDFELANSLFMQLSKTDLDDSLLKLYLEKTNYYSNQEKTDDLKHLEVFEY